MKEIKITIPDSCELIKDGNTYIVKEKKQTPPKSWKEFCERYPVKKGEAFINLCGSVEVRSTDYERHIRVSKNWCTSEEEAEAFLALMQLRHLRKAWVGEWNPTSETKLFAWIETSHNHYKTYVNYGTQECGRVLSFPTKIMAEDFLGSFRDLCEKAKILL